VSHYAPRHEGAGVAEHTAPLSLKLGTR